MVKPIKLTWIVNNCKDIGCDPDLWPYHAEFTRMCQHYRKVADPEASDRDIYHAGQELRRMRHRVRKNSKLYLPTFKREQRPLLKWVDGADELLVRLYSEQPYVLSKLPYTDEFEGIYLDISTYLLRNFHGYDRKPQTNRWEVIRALNRLQKAGRLKKKGETVYRGRKTLATRIKERGEGLGRFL